VRTVWVVDTKLHPSDLAATLVRLRAEQVPVLQIGARDTLWRDADGRFHSEPGCWGANEQVTVDADDLVALEVPEQQWCDCGGWRRSSLAWALLRAKTMYDHIADHGSAIVREQSFEEAARLLALAESLAYRVDGLEVLQTEMQQSIAEGLAELKRVLPKAKIFEAVAAQVVKIPVTAEQGPLLRSWASSKLIGDRTGVRAWLNEMFDEHVTRAISTSPWRRYLAAVPLQSTGHVLLWATTDETVVRGSWLLGEVCIPEVVAEGLSAMRGRCFALEEADDVALWRVVASLWRKNGQVEELEEAMSLARAVCRAPRAE
jgi:hypothetical protein